MNGFLRLFLRGKVNRILKLLEIVKILNVIFNSEQVTVGTDTEIKKTHRYKIMKDD